MKKRGKEDVSQTDKDSEDADMRGIGSIFLCKVECE